MVEEDRPHRPRKEDRRKARAVRAGRVARKEAAAQAARVARVARTARVVVRVNDQACFVRKNENYELVFSRLHVPPPINKYTSHAPHASASTLNFA